MNLLFLDTETTGKGPDDRLLQVAYKYQEFNYCELFKPPVPISFEAMATHHITAAMVEHAPAFAGGEMFNALDTLLNDAGKILVAHNAEFDKDMLEREGLKVPNYICTLKVAQALFDEPSYKLQVLRYKYDLDVQGVAHSADGDVAVLEKLFNFLCNKFAETHTGNYAEALAEMQAITLAPTLLRRIGFGKYKGMAFAEIPKDYLQWLGRQPENDENLKYTINHYLKTI